MDKSERLDLAIFITTKIGIKESYTIDDVVKICADSYQLGKQVVANEMSEGLEQLKKLNRSEVT